MGGIKGQQIDHTRIYLKQIAKMGEFFTAIKNFIRQTTSLIQHGSYCMSNAYNSALIVLVDLGLYYVKFLDFRKDHYFSRPWEEKKIIFYFPNQFE